MSKSTRRNPQPKMVSEAQRNLSPDAIAQLGKQTDNDYKRLLELLATIQGVEAKLEHAIMFGAYDEVTGIASRIMSACASMEITAKRIASIDASIAAQNKGFQL